MTGHITGADAKRMLDKPTAGAAFPHHCSAARTGRDAITLSLWNEDGTHVEDVSLTNATALDLLAVVAVATASD